MACCPGACNPSRAESARAVRRGRSRPVGSARGWCMGGRWGPFARCAALRISRAWQRYCTPAVQSDVRAGARARTLVQRASGSYYYYCARRCTRSPAASKHSASAASGPPTRVEQRRASAAERVALRTLQHGGLWCCAAVGLWGCARGWQVGGGAGAPQQRRALRMRVRLPVRGRVRVRACGAASHCWYAGCGTCCQ